MNIFLLCKYFLAVFWLLARFPGSPPRWLSDRLGSRRFYSFYMASPQNRRAEREIHYTIHHSVLNPCYALCSHLVTGYRNTLYHLPCLSCFLSLLLCLFACTSQINYLYTHIPSHIFWGTQTKIGRYWWKTCSHIEVWGSHSCLYLIWLELCAN